MTYVDEFLEHYGKKGMKWGIRNKSRGSSKKSKKETSIKVKKLSDDDLRKTINRLQMEKQYSSLVKDSSKNAGAEFVKGLGKTVVTTAVTTVVAKKIGAALKKNDSSK